MSSESAQKKSKKKEKCNFKSITMLCHEDSKKKCAIIKLNATEIMDRKIDRYINTGRHRF